MENSVVVAVVLVVLVVVVVMVVIVVVVVVAVVVVVTVRYLLSLLIDHFGMGRSFSGAGLLVWNGGGGTERSFYRSNQ